jgi:LemA protein
MVEGESGREELSLMVTIIYILLALWLPVVVAAVLYNRLVQLRNMKDEAWSGIDVQLKRRNDLVPNLVEVVKGYADHERDLFENIARIRSDCQQASSLKGRSDSETEMTHSLKSLFAVAESYPQLLANQNFMELQKNLTELEDEIQMARRYYNGSVRNYNIAVESFPGNLVANLSHFETAEFFALETLSDRIVPTVNLGSPGEKV